MTTPRMLLLSLLAALLTGCGRPDCTRQVEGKPNALHQWGKWNVNPMTGYQHRNCDICGWQESRL